MRNPTMKEARKVESKDDARNLALFKKYEDLENMWKSQENSRRRRSTASYRYSSTTITSIDHHHLFQTSPKTLMASLQHREPTARIKSCSIEVEEILMDRRAAILSGRFKGRQLFAAEDETSAEESSLSLTYSGGGVMCSDGIQGREVMVNYEVSSDFRGSCSSPEAKAKAVVGVVEKRGGGRGGCWAATASLGAVLIVLALLLSSLCNANNFEKLILVPT